MKPISITTEEAGGLSSSNLKDTLRDFTHSIPPGIRNILIIPPDSTRKHSQAGFITNILYQQLRERFELTIMPALGTHDPMCKEKIRNMFGKNIPLDLFVEHKWRKDTVNIGEIPAHFVNEVSQGNINRSIDVSINKRLVNGNFDLIISIGQVLPHEVVGMSNYTKNIVVGCGGEKIINMSHYIGALYGLERLIGRDHSPVRKLYDYVENNLIDNLPIEYILTVNRSHVDEKDGLADLVGLFTGRERKVFEKAVKLSQKVNITYLKNKVNKFVVYLDPGEYKSTWLGCKGIYRTRIAVENGGQIVIIAPGLNTIGEDEEFDRLMRKYGYVGKDQIMEYVEKNDDLKDNLAAPAHLIHGSTEGRFQVTYASDRITREEIEAVNFNYMSMKQAREIYEPKNLSPGYNTLKDGNQVYYIENPGVGLWVNQEQFEAINEV